MGSRPHYGVIFGFAVSALILCYLLSNIEWQSFVRELHRVNFLWLPPLFAVFMFSFWVRAMRWRFLLPTGLSIPTKRLFNAVNLGGLATAVLPLRAGEFVRPWVLTRSKQISFSLGFSSVVTERVFDVLAMLTLFVFTLGAIDNPPAWAPVCAKALAVLALGILTVMLLAYFKGPFIERLAVGVIDSLFTRRMPAAGGKLSEMAGDFILGLRSISTPRELVAVIIGSYALWLCISLFYYIGLLAFGLSPAFAVANALNVCIALAVAAPSAPGFLGTFQLGCVAALTNIYGYSEEFSLACSVVLYAVQMISTILLGIYALHAEGLSFKQLRSRS